MKIDPQILLYLQQLIPQQRGVFSTSDLYNFFNTSNRVVLMRELKPLLEAKVLTRFCRGFYVAKEFSKELLSQRINPESAVSLTTVLAKELVVGTIAHRTVYAVKMGTTSTYESELGQIIHLGFCYVPKKKIWFGYDHYEEGVRYADKEKAFLDALYFYQSGLKLTFDVYSDVYVSDFDQTKMNAYLKKYQNPKFVQFVRGILDGKHS